MRFQGRTRSPVRRSRSSFLCREEVARSSNATTGLSQFAPCGEREVTGVGQLESFTPAYLVGHAVGRERYNGSVARSKSPPGGVAVQRELAWPVATALIRRDGQSAPRERRSVPARPPSTSDPSANCPQGFRSQPLTSTTARSACGRQPCLRRPSQPAVRARPLTWQWITGRPGAAGRCPRPQRGASGY